MAWDYFGKAGSSMGLLNSGSTNQDLDRKIAQELDPMLQAQAGRGGFSNAVVNQSMMADKAQEIKDIDRTRNTIINDVPVFDDTPTRAGTYALEMGRLADMEAQGEEAAGALTTDPKPVDPETPASVVPDAAADPGGYLAATTQNRGLGAGNTFGMPKIPTPPSPASVAQNAMEEQGKQVMFDQNKIPEWHKSRAFSGGLLSFGLNLLSGNDLATSFNQAGNYFEQGFAKEKREAWANDLVDAGYDAQDIQRWIETGDNKDLPDPMEKKMRMQQYQLGAEQLSAAQYENTPEMRLFKQQMQLAPLEMQRAQMAQSAAQFSASHDLALRKAEREDMKAAGYGYNPITKKYEKGLGVAKPLDKEGLKQLGYYGRAQNSMAEFENVFEKQGGIKALQERGKMGTFVDDMQMKALASDKGITPDLARHFDSEQAELFDAQYGFITAVLRRESGAAISQSEWDRYSRMYFPRPSDTPQQIAYKNKLRAREMLTMNPNVTADVIQAVDSGRLTDIRNINGQTYVRDTASGQIIRL